MRVLLIMLFLSCIGFSQERRNDTIIQYLDGRGKLINFEKLKDTDSIQLPIYRCKWFYHAELKKYVEIRCRLRPKKVKELPKQNYISI